MPEPSRKLLRLCAACLVAIWMAAFSAVAREGAIRVGIYENRPMVFVDTDGKPAGVYVDLMKEIAQREGWQLDFVPGSWPENLERLERGLNDVLVDIGFSEERTRRFDFSEENVFATWAQIYVHKDSDIRSYEDLEGKKIAVLREDVHYPALRHILDSFDIQVEFVEFGDYFAVLDACSTRKADACLLSRIAGMVHEAKYAVERSPMILDPIKIHFAFPKGRGADLKSAIDRHLKAWKRDPDSPLNRILARWLPDTKATVLPDWLGWGVGGALSLVALLLATSSILRTQVRARTAELRESEQRTRSVIESALDAVVVMDADGTITNWNPQAEATFGLSREEALGRNFMRTMISSGHDPSEPSGFTDKFASCGIGPTRIETSGVRGSGEEFPIELSISLVRLGEKPIISAFVRDISEHRRAQEARERLVAVEQELSVARQIQQAILHKTFPAYPDRDDFDIYAEMIPAKEVGGDFYDFFLVEAGRLGVVIGDVSGKGVPAAILMGGTRAILRATALQGQPPDDCLRHVNRLACENRDATTFVSALYGVLDLRSGNFSFSNAGHNFPYLVSPGKEPQVRRIGGRTGIALGVLPEGDFAVETVRMDPGDAIFLYTDGVTEAMDPAREMFEEDRLLSTLAEGPSATPRELVARMTGSIHGFTRGAAQSDDITMLALRFIRPAG